jgi:hypothetical protein
MQLKTVLLIAAMAAAFSVQANDLRTGIGGAVGGAGGAAIGNEVGGSKGAIVGAGVGGAAGAVIGGSMTADSGKPQTQAKTQPPVTIPAGQPGPTMASCNRNNPGKGRALGHCKH